MLEIPRQSTSVSVCSLLSTFLSQPQMLNCSLCQSGVQATYVVTPGKFTILGINRIQYCNRQQQPLVKTKLSEDRSNGIGNNVLGTLISVASHIDGGRGHWISYHRVGPNWFSNSDNQPIARHVNHPFHTLNPDETPDVLFFANS